MTHNKLLFLDTAEYVEMCEIVDPYSYLGRYGRSQTVQVSTDRQSGPGPSWS